MRINTKPPETMTAGQINQELDLLDTASSLVTEELIAAGRGLEWLQGILKMDDPLSQKAKGFWERKMALRAEIKARYGPDAPSRLPTGRGFGPREKVKRGR